jgi:hypothetical protein
MLGRREQEGVQLLQYHLCLNTQASGAEGGKLLEQRVGRNLKSIRQTVVFQDFSPEFFLFSQTQAALMTSRCWSV